MGMGGASLMGQTPGMMGPAGFGTQEVYPQVTPTYVMPTKITLKQQDQQADGTIVNKTINMDVVPIDTSPEVL